MNIFINKVDPIEEEYTYVDMYCFNIIIGCILSVVLGVAGIGLVGPVSVHVYTVNDALFCFILCTCILVEHNLLSEPR